MPTYEYSCELCGHRLEIFQSIRDERLVKCPACEKEGLKRLIGTGAGIIFKGSGFYQTDYKSGAGKPAGGEGPAEKKPAPDSSAPSPAPSTGSSAPAAAPASTPTS